MEDTDDQVTEVVQFKAERGYGGRFLKKPEAIMKHSFTSENAADMARRRWQKYRESAADAVAEEIGSIVPGVTTPEAAWGVLNARLAAQIMDSDKPRGDDLKALGINMGAIPNVYERSEMENTSAGSLAGAGEALTAILGILREAMQPARDVIDGTATTVDKDTITRNE